MKSFVFIVLLFCSKVYGNCDASLLKDMNSLMIILTNTDHPEKVKISDLRLVLNSLPPERKIEVQLSVQTGFSVKLQFPNPKFYPEFIIKSWVRSYLAAVYLRTMALGFPDHDIYIHLDKKNDFSLEIQNLILKEIERYFTDHSETLSKKASPSSGEVKFFISEEIPSTQGITSGSQISPEENPKTLRIKVSEPIVVGLDQGARGVSVAVFRGDKNISEEVFGEDSESLRQEDLSFYYLYTFRYGSSGGSGEEFTSRLFGFINRVINKVEQKLKEKLDENSSKVSSIFLGMPGVKSQNGSFVSLGQIARGFGSPETERELYAQNMDVVNNNLRNFQSELKEKGIVFGFDNDMLPWSQVVLNNGHMDAIAIIAGGGQGQLVVRDGKYVLGNCEGGHQSVFPLMENCEYYNMSSPPGSFESMGLGNPGILFNALRKSKLEPSIRKEFVINENQPIEVLHLGRLLTGKNPITNERLSRDNYYFQNSVKNKVWRIIADIEAEHILYLYFYSGVTNYIFSGGPVSGETGKVFKELVKEALNKKMRIEKLEIPFQLYLLEDSNPAERAALKAMSLMSH